MINIPKEIMQNKREVARDKNLQHIHTPNAAFGSVRIPVASKNRERALAHAEDNQKAADDDDRVTSNHIVVVWQLCLHVRALMEINVVALITGDRAPFCGRLTW